MRENMLQQKEEGLATLAALGRNEDTHLAHVAPDEMIVPAQVLRDNPLLKTYVLNSISKYGVDPNKYIVGNGDMDLNPLTGLPEFGFLSKVFKKIKKVVKKVAPVAMFIPGVGQALGAVGGSLLGKVGLGNVASGIGSFVGKIPGLGGVGNAITAGSGGGLGSALSFGRDAITSGIGSLFTPKGMMSQVMQGGFGPAPLDQQYNGGGFIPMQQQYYGGGFIPTFGSAPGVFDQQQPPLQQPQQRGGILNFLSRKLLPQSIEDAIQGKDGNVTLGSMFTREGGGLNTLGAGGLAALVGKIAYDQAKSRSGGLAETPAVTMDQLGRYQLSKALGTGGTREEFGLAPAPKALKFAEGGVAELDMRQGGESAGPGTGTSDDIPAMLSDGEFVMTAKATRGAGAYNVKTSKGGIELVKTSSPSREAGVKNMRKLMKTFEAV
tara:strand:+ start:1661 stop:2968 length:1308 start_codon:yes stop_codon:yes gene_type:complete